MSNSDDDDDDDDGNDLILKCVEHSSKENSTRNRNCEREKQHLVESVSLRFDLFTFCSHLLCIQVLDAVINFSYTYKRCGLCWRNMSLA